MRKLAGLVLAAVLALWGSGSCEDCVDNGYICGCDAPQVGLTQSCKDLSGQYCGGDLEQGGDAGNVESAFNFHCTPWEQSPQSQQDMLVPLCCH